VRRDADSRHDKHTTTMTTTTMTMATTMVTTAMTTVYRQQAAHVRVAASRGKQKQNKKSC
jgi:hypothetical protein